MTGTYIPSQSRIRPYMTRAVTADRHSAWNGISFIVVIGMSISAVAPPITRRASCGPIAVLIATPRPL